MLESIPGNPEGSEWFSIKDGSQDVEVVFWTWANGKVDEVNVDSPADDVPGLANMAEFCGARAGVAKGYGKPCALNKGIRERENDVARLDLAKEVVKSIARPIALPFG